MYFEMSFLLFIFIFLVGKDLMISQNMILDFDCFVIIHLSIALMLLTIRFGLIFWLVISRLRSQNNLMHGLVIFQYIYVLKYSWLINYTKFMVIIAVVIISFIFQPLTIASKYEAYQGMRDTMSMTDLCIIFFYSLTREFF